MLADFVEALGEGWLDVDAHVFGALHHQRLVNDIAQQIFLLVLELRVNLVLRAALAITRRFIAQFFFGFLIIGEGDDVVVDARDYVSVRRGLGLRADARSGQRNERRQRDDGEAQPGPKVVTEACLRFPMVCVTLDFVHLDCSRNQGKSYKRNKAGFISMSYNGGASGHSQLNRGIPCYESAHSPLCLC